VTEDLPCARVTETVGEQNTLGMCVSLYEIRAYKLRALPRG